jgi:MobC-like protein
MRTQRFTIRMTPDEYQRLGQFAATTINSGLSDYCRCVLLKAPVNLLCRNQSLDDFQADMLLMRKDLLQIGALYNQAVHRLHMVCTTTELQHWLLLNEQDKNRMFRLFEQIFTQFNEANRIWSQK